MGAQKQSIADAFRIVVPMYALLLNKLIYIYIFLKQNIFNVLFYPNRGATLGYFQLTQVQSNKKAYYASWGFSPRRRHYAALVSTSIMPN